MSGHWLMTHSTLVLCSRTMIQKMPASPMAQKKRRMKVLEWPNLNYSTKKSEPKLEWNGQWKLKLNSAQGHLNFLT